ncbi:Protein of unknown function DUF669 [uncultured Caudovirales phage]|uniref:DUF669 domain-containing protein n=1 Tax=uncultured Caudovirales phage TaxID=2100421 RepID=A0A6J5SII2_9CAUD|nr:Protein of unknown function DUF669 [uncultured Caudovirales phage]
MEAFDFDYDNFDPNAKTYPPTGKYIIQVVGIEEKPSKAGYRMINIHFKIVDGDQKGVQFTIGYYVSNPNTEQAKWAKEALGRLYFGATGEKLTNQGFKTFEKDIQFKAISALVDTTPNKEGSVFVKIKNLVPHATPASFNAPLSVTLDDEIIFDR